MATKPYQPAQTVKGYDVYKCGLDGIKYAFPKVEPVIMGSVAKNWKNDTGERSKGGNWLDAKLVPDQTEGYFGWKRRGNFILNMRPETAFADDKYAYVGRFSYDPETQEILLGRLEQSHAETISRFGSRSFGKYVRGIFLRDARVLLIRAFYDGSEGNGSLPEFDPDLDEIKREQTIDMLVKNNLPKGVRVIGRVDNEVVKQFDPRNV
ncbi:hypothetical protein ACFLZX_03595 [Nanoarchaeota archaeon]